MNVRAVVNMTWVCYFSAFFFVVDDDSKLCSRYVPWSVQGICQPGRRCSGDLLALRLSLWDNL